MHDDDAPAQPAKQLARLTVELYTDGSFVVDGPFQDRAMFRTLLGEAEFQLLVYQLEHGGTLGKRSLLVTPGRS